MSDGDLTDELPADLDVSGLVGPYVFPNTNRRRLAGALYLATAAICLVVAATTWGSARVNAGVVAAAIGLIAIGAHHLVTGWNTAVDEFEALEAAAGVVGFPVGHASAQLSWRGWASRPAWRILAYAAEDQPSERAFVLVDARSGKVLEHLVEPNPEDWSELA